MENIINVVLITYNRAQFLRDSIDSVLNQSFKNYRFIVIDNGSNDDTAKILKSYKNRFLVIRNSINSETVFEQAFSYTKSKYLTIIHDDDVLNSNFLEKNIQELEKHEDVKFCASRICFFGENITKKINPFLMRTRIWETNEYIKTYLLRGNIIPFPTIVYRTSFLSQIKPEFNSKKTGPASDLLHIFKIDSLKGKIILLKDCMYNYRIHQNQDSIINNLNLEFKIHPFIKNFYSSNKKISKKYTNASLAIIFNIILSNFFKTFDLKTFKKNFNSLKKFGFKLNFYTIYWSLYSFFRVIRNFLK